MAKRWKDGDPIFRWNFVMGLIHGVFFRAGMAFSEPNTVLPLFFSGYTSARWVIGLFSAIFQLSATLPQLVAAHRLERICHRKPVLVASILIRMACWGIIGVITYCFGKQHPAGILVLFILLLAIFNIAGAFAVIPFYDVVGRTIPADWRGRFWAYRQFGAGLLAIGAAAVVHRVLSNPNLVFPKNYGVLFFLSFVSLGVAYLGLGSVRIPAPEECHEGQSFARFLSSAGRVLKENRRFARAVAVELLAGSLLLTLPFYVVYVREELGADASVAGTFIGVQTAAGILSNLFWGRFNDTYGSRQVIRLATAANVLIPLVALTARGTAWFYVVFALIGFYMVGSTIGYSNYMLDLAPDKERPRFVSLRGSLTAPVALYPLLGGALMDVLSFRAVLLVALILTLAGAGLAVGLEEARAR